VYGAMVELYRQGKTVVLGGKKPVPVPPYNTHLIQFGFGLNPGLCGKKCKILGTEFVEKN